MNEAPAHNDAALIIYFAPTAHETVEPGTYFEVYFLRKNAAE